MLSAGLERFYESPLSHKPVYHQACRYEHEEGVQQQPPCPRRGLGFGPPAGVTIWEGRLDPDDH